MASHDDQAAQAGQEWVVIASLENRRAAEHMLASLGHEFRRSVRKGRADGLVATTNADGSLKLTESRALEATGLAATMTRLSLSDGGFPGHRLNAETRQDRRARGPRTRLARRLR